MPHQPIDILFFAEDPGAANYIAPLAGECAAQCLSSVIIGTGKALITFAQRRQQCIRAENFASARRMLEVFKPRLVVVGTSENKESLGLQLISEARETRVPTSGIVDSFMNAAYRFRGMRADPLAYAPDWLIVCDPWTRDEFVKLGFQSERVEVCGHPHYDFVREKRDEFESKGEKAVRKQFFPEALLKEPLVVFVAEQEGGLNADQFLKSPEYTLLGMGGGTRNEIVLEEFLDAIAQLRKRPYLVLRLHPKNTPEEFRAYRGRFDFVSHKEPALELVYAADYVFGMTSMLLIEAAILGKFTFSIVPREIECTWLPTVRSGLTRCAYTREQIRRMLPQFVAGGPTAPFDGQEDGLIYGASQKVTRFFGEIINQSISMAARYAPSPPSSPRGGEESN